MTMVTIMDMVKKYVRVKRLNVTTLTKHIKSNITVSMVVKTRAKNEFLSITDESNQHWDFSSQPVRSRSCSFNSCIFIVPCFVLFCSVLPQPQTGSCL